MRVVCITNDVEATTIQGKAYDETVALRVKEEALPVALTLYDKYGVKVTFFCLGKLIEEYPEIVQQIEAHGHEVACHGWKHDSDLAYDVLSLEEQIKHLTNAKNIIDKVTKTPIVSFRAPALRVNEYTVQALKQTGFKYDSSVASQRLDAFISLGSKKKMLWINAPRGIYETAENNLSRRGTSGITEVPVSAFGLPYIGAMLRLSPCLTVILRWLLYFETKGNNKKVVNLLFHPNELIERHESLNIIRRSKNPIVHLLTGKLRVLLKRRNFGGTCIRLVEREIRFWQKHGYEFKTIKEL